MEAAVNLDDEPLREGARYASGGHLSASAARFWFGAADEVLLTREQRCRAPLMGEVFRRPVDPTRPAETVTVTVQADEVRDVRGPDLGALREAVALSRKSSALHLDELYAREAMRRICEPREGETLADAHDRLRRQLAALPERPLPPGGFGGISFTIPNPGDDQ